ncbi:hypothetical protein CEK69_20545, partial [Xanthomonas sp. LMG 12462]
IKRPCGEGTAATSPGKGVQDPYALVHFNANYQLSTQWTATLAVTNALNKKYWANLDYQNYGEPRFVSFTLRWRY